MALILSDRVKETTVTSGTGTISLGGALGGFRTFDETIGEGNTTYYAIENDAQFEVGIGTYSGNTLSRDTVFSSSNSGSKISLNGVSFVFCVYPASRTVVRDADNNMVISGSISVDDITSSGDLTISGGVDVTGDMSVDDITATSLKVLNLTASGDVVLSSDATLTSSGLLTLKRDSAGSFLHSYVDDGINRTIALYSDGTSAPEWRLGLKNNPNDSSAAPSYAYIFAEDGNIGLVANSDNSISLTHGGGYVLKNQSNVIFKSASQTGTYIFTYNTAYPSLTVKGVAAQASNLQEWQDSSSTILAKITKDGSIYSSGTINADNGILFDGTVPNSTTNKLYNQGGALYFDGTQLGGDVSAAQVYANSASGVVISGIANQNKLDLAVVSGIANQNDLDIAVVSGIANNHITDYLTHASGDSFVSEIRDNSSSGVAISGYNQIYTDIKINNLIDSAPSTLDTLNEIATALSGDASLAVTLTNQIRANSASGVAISGIAVYASGHNLQSVTNNGSGTTNSITITNNNITATSGLFDVLDMTPLAEANYPTHQEGVLFYDDDNHTLSLYNDEADVTLQLGQEEFLRVRNNTGATITNGQAVLITGAHGNAAPTISGAIATTEANSQIVGLATHSIETDSFGYVTTYGIVRNVDTSHCSAGDEIFLSATQIGSGINVAPTIPNYKVTIGHVIRSHSANGSILVQIGHPKLGGGDLKSEAALNISGVPFVTSISDTTAGGSQTDPLFVFDSGNRQLQLASGVQLLNGAPSNTSNVLYNEGGTLKFNGSAVGGTPDYTSSVLYASGINIGESGINSDHQLDLIAAGYTFKTKSGSGSDAQITLADGGNTLDIHAYGSNSSPAIRLGGTTPGTSASETMFFTEGGGVTAFKLGDRNRSIQYVFGQGGAASQNDHLIFRAGGGIGWSHETSTVGYPDTLLRRNSSGVLDIYKSDRSAAGSLTYGGLNVGYILTTPPAATDVGHTIKGAAAQSADLAQYQSNAGIVTAKITSDGSIASSGTIEASGNLLTNSTLKANTIEGITALNIYNKSGGGNRIQMGNADTIFYQPMRAVDGIQPNSNNLTTSSLGTETSRWYESHITSGNFYHGIVLSGVPAVTTNALYLDGSTLKFNGSAVGGASDALPHASGDFLLTEIRTNSASGDYTSSILSASGVSVTSSGIRFSHPGNSEYVELAFAGSKFVINSVANGGTARNIALQEDGTDRFYMNAANNAVQVAANLYPSNDASKLLGYTTLRWGVGYFDQLDQEIHTASDVGHVIKGAASQSADLSQWQNNSSTVLASVDNEGSLSIASGHLHIYNPTADGINDTNYERLEIGFDSNTVKIKAAKNGTGSSRVLTLDSHSQVNLKYNNSNRLRVGSSAVTLYTVLSPSSDLNSNIGETSKRFNKGFIHEITASGLNVSGVSLGDHVPVNTTNALYNDGGTLKFNGSAVGGGGGGMSNFILEDGDGTEVTIGDGKEVKFVEGAGIDIDWTDVSDGSDSDPYDLTFTVDHDAASNFVANEHIDHTSVTLTAGDGLTGGGDISSNRTFAVGAGAGITVNANDVAVASGNASGVAFFSGTGGSNLTSSSEFLFDSTDCELFLNQDGSNICFAGSDGDKALKLGNSADSGTNAGKIWLYLNNSTIATMQVGSAGLVQELNNTDDNIQFRDGNNDNVFIIEGGDEAYNTLTTAAGATKIAHVIKGASAQSANLQEWRSNADTTIAHIGSDGSISTSGTLGASGDITGNGGATIAGSLGVGAGDHGSYKVNVNTTSADHTLVINDSNGRIGIKTESLSGDLNIGGSRIVNVVGGNANIRSDDGWLSFRAGGSSNESLSLVGDTVRFAGFDGGAQLNMRTRVTGRRTLVIEKLTSQTADLLNVRDENDDPYFVIDAAGDVDATGLITANSGITLNRVTPASTTDKLYNIAGSLYFNGSAVGGGMSNFILEDGDGTEVTVADGKEIKFVEGAGIDIDWTDVSDGSDSDPYDLTFTVDHDAANNFVANEHIDHTSVTLTAGDGLTGGGDISSNRTFAVGAGDGITVNANDVALATGNPSGVSFFGGDAGLGKLTSISELVIESGQNRIYQFPKGGSAELVKLGWNAAGDTYLINSVANGGTARNIELAVDGDAVLTLNAAQSKIVLAGDLDPDNDASRELGSSTRRFANVYTDQLNAFCHTASDVCVQVKAHASQSANVQSWRTSGGTEFVGIGPDGGIVLPDNTPSSTTNKLYNNGGTLTFNGSAVGGGGGMSNFILEDDSGDEVTISDGKEVKFIGDGVTINWTDTSDGSDADPYDLTFTLDTVSVAKGGTNATSFADKSVIISQDSGTDTLSALALTTNGQLVIGGSSGPAAATLTAGTSISITNADGGITIAYAGGPAPSDEKLKENIKELPNCLEKIDKLSPVSFDWNNLAHEELDKQGSDIGLIAQEVEEIFPEIVGDTQGFKGLDYLKLTVILIKAVQELRQEVENLKSTPN